MLALADTQMRELLAWSSNCPRLVDAMSFASRIRRARLHAELTQGELAARVQVQRSAVSHWENVEGARPTGENLANVASATGVRFEWLATGRGPMRIQEDEQQPALVLSEFAQDDLESRLLQAIRQLAVRKRKVIVELVEGLAK